MKYGVGYVGSKNTIAADIINALPSGNRLIDLFGGGGAITHCATLSNKYNTVVYNDYDLFFKRFWNGQWWWYSSASHIKPITFTEFLNNRSLSRYIQKARKEVNKNAKSYINHT